MSDEVSEKIAFINAFIREAYERPDTAVWWKTQKDDEENRREVLLQQELDTLRAENKALRNMLEQLGPDIARAAEKETT